jgi:hypothetical protein
MVWMVYLVMTGRKTRRLILQFSVGCGMMALSPGEIRHSHFAEPTEDTGDMADSYSVLNMNRCWTGLPTPLPA